MGEAQSMEGVKDCEWRGLLFIEVQI